MHLKFPSAASLAWAAAFVAVGIAVGGRLPGAALPKAAAATALADASFAVCTAPIDANTEGLFMLDFETGDLSGSVLNQNTGTFGVAYRYNVLKDLDFKAGKVKNPKFLLVPGLASFAGNNRLAPAVLYVTDAATGVTVAYGIGAQDPSILPLDKTKPRAAAARP
jgi:hypothetical protein